MDDRRTPSSPPVVPLAGAGETSQPASRPPRQDDASKPGPSVTILMATYNGAAHLDAQLHSIAGQTHANWTLVVSDDGSTDRTRAILAAFAAGRPAARVEVHDGPALKGRSSQAPAREARELATENFLSLISQRARTGDYFAFSDQDDLWEPDKLERAVRWLQDGPQDLPALYCSRTRLMDEQGRDVGLSPRFERSPSFRNALVQSLAGGNTIVMNRAARDLVAAAGVVSVVAHDWWIYILVAGCNGRIRYDPHPSVRYRQHSANLVGSNRGLNALVARARLVWDGGWARWTDRHLEALEKVAHLLTPDNRVLLVRFSELRRGRLADRWRLLSELGLYRQTTMGKLSLLLAVVTRRL